MKEGLEDETATDEIVTGIPIDQSIFGSSIRFDKIIAYFPD